MSSFLDRLDQIREGVSTPLGFGAPRAQKIPGMALVGLVSREHSKGIALLADLKPDAALVSGVPDPSAVKELVQTLGDSLPWGAKVSALTEENAKALEEAGCDIQAFSLDGTTVAAVGSEEVARILCIKSDIDIEYLRAVDALPIDALLLSVPTPSSPWTLEDLAAIAGVSRRVSKYVLLETSQLPAAKELEAMRDVGVNGLVVDVAGVSPESLGELKSALLEMPRQRPRRKEKSMALLPNSAFPSASAPEPEQPDPDEDE